MAKLSDSRPTEQITLSGGCIVQVYKSFTVADQRALEATYGPLTDLPKERLSDAAIDMALKLIKSWDMVDDEGNVVPLTTEVFAANIPQPDISLIASSLKKDLGEAN